MHTQEEVGIVQGTWQRAEKATEGEGVKMAGAGRSARETALRLNEADAYSGLGETVATDDGQKSQT